MNASDFHQSKCPAPATRAGTKPASGKAYGRWRRFVCGRAPRMPTEPRGIRASIAVLARTKRPKAAWRTRQPSLKNSAERHSGRARGRRQRNQDAGSGHPAVLSHRLREVGAARRELGRRTRQARIWVWKLIVFHDWPNTECLPCDLVSVEGHLVAHGGHEPVLGVRRVRLLRQDITGERRKLLLECKDPLERWKRARRASRWG